MTLLITIHNKPTLLFFASDFLSELLWDTVVLNVLASYSVRIVSAEFVVCTYVTDYAIAKPYKTYSFVKGEGNVRTFCITEL